MTRVEPTKDIYNGSGGSLPAAPLVPIIQRDAELEYADRTSNRGKNDGQARGMHALAERVGVGQRRLYEYATGRAKFIPLDTADRYCCRTNRHLRQIWPSLYTDEQIAADVEAVEHEADYWHTKRNARIDRERARHVKKRATQKATEA